jgi:hypothetical protein
MKEYIINKLKTYYNEGFLQSSGPVYLLHDFIGKKLAVEMGTATLGSSQEEIDCSLEEMFKSYPEDKFYCIFYTTTGYKSEKAKKEFLEKYYKENSRIPEYNISEEDINYTDSFGLRVVFINRTEYENRYTYFDEFSFKEYEDQVVFFKYYDDSLYLKEKEVAQKWAEQYDKYLLAPINKKEYFIERYGFIRDIGKNISKLKEATEERYGDLFISWVAPDDIYLRLQEHGDKKYIIIRERGDINPDRLFKKDYESLSKLVSDKKFKTEKEVTQFIKENLVSRRLVIQVEEVTEKIYDNHIILDQHDWLRLPETKETKKYDLKNWGNVQTVINDILKTTE